MFPVLSFFFLRILRVLILNSCPDWSINSIIQFVVVFTYIYSFSEISLLSPVSSSLRSALLAGHIFVKGLKHPHLCPFGEIFFPKGEEACFLVEDSCPLCHGTTFFERTFSFICNPLAMGQEEKLLESSPAKLGSGEALCHCPILSSPGLLLLLVCLAWQSAGQCENSKQKPRGAQLVTSAVARQPTPVPSFDSPQAEDPT